MSKVKIRPHFLPPTYFGASGNSITGSTHGVCDLFTGERYVTEIGLYDLRNRYFLPDLGRFMQPDPIGFKGDASNLYRYCGNDWANKSDPMGLDPIPTDPQKFEKKKDHEKPKDPKVPKRDNSKGYFKNDSTGKFRNYDGDPHTRGTGANGETDRVVVDASGKRPGATTGYGLAEGAMNWTRSIARYNSAHPAETASTLKFARAAERFAMVSTIPLAVAAAPAVLSIGGMGLNAARPAATAAIGYGLTHPQETQEFASGLLEPFNGAAPGTYAEGLGFIGDKVTEFVATGSVNVEP